MADPRWEFGSLLDFASFPAGLERGDPSWSQHPHALLGSGRDAARHAVRAGGYKRVWLASYNCQVIYDRLRMDGTHVLRYPDDPLRSRASFEGVDLRAGDAVVVTNYFGLRDACDLRSSLPQGVGLIEDHTHDSVSDWARSSSADYCFASLRKLWPMPDGGVVWTPTERSLPNAPPCTPALVQGVHERLTGMLLRSIYLAGHDVDKAQFRYVLAEAEHAVVADEVSGITHLSRQILATLPFAHFHVVRRQHFLRWQAALEGFGGVTLLLPNSEACVPFVATLCFDDPAARDLFQAAVSPMGVYASVFWPQVSPWMEGIRDSDLELSARLCALTLDLRYDEQDTMRAIGIVTEALQHLAAS